MSLELERLSVLFLEDSLHDFELVGQKLTDEFTCPIRFDRAETEQEFIQSISAHAYDIILADYTLPGYDATAALRQVMNICPAVPFICVSGTIGEDLAVEILKQGATDYVLKDRLGRLSFAILRALEAANEKNALHIKEGQLHYKSMIASIADTTSAMMWISCAEEGDIWLNHQWLAYTGHTMAQDLGEGWQQSIHPDDLQDYLKAFISSYSIKEIYTAECRIRKFDGTYRWFQCEGRPYHDKENDIDMITGVCIDINDRKLLELELKRITESFEEAQKVAHIGSWVLDILNSRYYWSDEAYRIFGLDPKTTVLYRDILYADMVEEDKQRVADTFAAAIRDRSPIEVEFAIRSNDGIRTYVRIHGGAQYDAEGNMSQIIGTFQDITEHKLLEMEATRINRNLAEAQRLAHIGSWEWDPKTGSVEWSEEMYRIYQLDPGTFNPTYESVFAFVHPDDKETIFQTAREANKNKTPFTVEHRLVLADGAVRHILAHGFSCYGKDGKLEYERGTTQDITERKLQEEALQQLYENNRLILDSTTEGIIMFDYNGIILNVNKTFLGRFGVPKENVIGIPYTKLLPQDRYGDLALRRLNKLRQVYDTGEPLVFEDSRDGRSYSNRMYPVFSNSKVCAVTLFSMDITDHARANDEEVRRLQTEARLNVMTEFFTNVSHELRTPLSLILMQMDMMRMHLGNEKKMAESLDAVTLNSYRLTRLVSNLLDITKMDSGFMSVNLRSRDIVSILRSICDSVYDYARAKSIELVFHTDIALKQVDLDREKIDRVILNLLSNAIKHTPAGGRISVELTDKQSSVQICVRDTGEGIPADKLQTVFERFAQVNNARSKPVEGCGIGLALVKSLTELHRGRVWAQSRLGEGSAFFVELPVENREVQKNNIAVEGFDLKKKVEMELSDLYIRL